MSSLKRELPVLLTLAMPLWRGWQSGGNPLFQRELDSIGHVWTVWNASIANPLRSTLVAWPEGADLLPILGGWLDIFLAGGLARLGLEPIAAFNIVLLGFLALVGAGLYALARQLGAGPWAALVAGLLGQLDPSMLFNFAGGRSEQISTGFLALAFATALSCWRKQGAWRWLACGLSGSAVIYASWEYGFWLALAMAWLAPFVVWASRPDGAVRRWLLAAATCAVTIGPFAALFLIRSSQVRELQEGLETMSWAENHAVMLGGWFVEPDSLRLGLPVLLCLLVVPWAAPREDRRVWVGVLTGLVLSFFMALGPRPGMWALGDLGANFPAPYVALQSLPVLGWFHTPDRLLIGWSVAAPVAAALVLQRLWRTPLPLPARVPVVLLLAGLALGSTFQQAQRSFTFLVSGWTPREPPETEAVRDAPLEGALLDLPPRSGAVETLLYMELQLVHQRPSPWHATLPHLTNASVPDMAKRLHLVDWLRSARDQTKPVPSKEELEADVELLKSEGYAFIVLHPQMIPRAQRKDVRRALKSVLGKAYVDSTRWAAWALEDLERPDDEEILERYGPDPSQLRGPKGPGRTGAGAPGSQVPRGPAGGRGSSPPPGPGR